MSPQVKAVCVRVLAEMAEQNKAVLTLINDFGYGDYRRRRGIAAWWRLLRAFGRQRFEDSLFEEDDYEDPFDHV